MRYSGQGLDQVCATLMNVIHSGCVDFVHDRRDYEGRRYMVLHVRGDLIRVHKYLNQSCDALSEIGLVTEQTTTTFTTLRHAHKHLIEMRDHGFTWTVSGTSHVPVRSVVQSPSDVNHDFALVCLGATMVIHRHEQGHVHTDQISCQSGELVYQKGRNYPLVLGETVWFLNNFASWFRYHEYHMEVDHG